MYLEKIKGKKRVVLEQMINEPMALKLKNGKVYAGCLDEYWYDTGGIVSLYHCTLLDSQNNKWIDHDIMIDYEEGPYPDPMPDFLIQEIEEILILPKEYAGLFLDDFLKIYLNPYYRPIVGIKCPRNKEGKHTPECDSELHNALNIIYDGLFPIGKQRTESDEREIWDAFGYIRNRLLLSGAKIP